MKNFLLGFFTGGIILPLGAIAIFFGIANYKSTDSWGSSKDYPSSEQAYSACMEWHAKEEDSCWIGCLKSSSSKAFLGYATGKEGSSSCKIKKTFTY